jgi:NAD(P)H-hydrate repair Nnr-like enzyme with NAD(P)H-hydrate epimerase domain
LIDWYVFIFRLAVTNSHQLPLAVVLCGTGQPGTLGLAAARQLASHGVRTQVYLPELAHYPHTIETELRLYRLTGGKVRNTGTVYAHAYSLHAFAARQLASNGVRTQVYLPELAHYPHTIETELRLYRLTGGKVREHYTGLVRLNCG